MKTRIIVWTCVGFLTAFAAGILIWETQRSGQFDLGHVYLLLLLAQFLMMAFLKLMQVIAQGRAEAGLPTPRWIALVGPRLGWTCFSLYMFLRGVSSGRSVRLAPPENRVVGYDKRLDGTYSILYANVQLGEVI